MEELHIELPVLESVAGMTLRDAFEHMRQRYNRGFIVSSEDGPVVVGMAEVLPELRVNDGDMAFANVLPRLTAKTYRCDFSVPSIPLLSQPLLRARFENIFQNNAVAKYAVIANDWSKIVTAHENFAYSLVGTVTYCTCTKNAKHVWLEDEPRVRGQCDYDNARLDCAS